MSGGFAQPGWLWILVALPALAWWLRPRRAQGVVVAQSPLSVDGTTPVLALIDATPLILRLAGMGAVVVALAGPQMVEVHEEPRVEGVGIALYHLRDREVVSGGAAETLDVDHAKAGYPGTRIDS